jgi:Uma2 family endonuclease
MTQTLIDLNRKYTSAEFEKLPLPDDRRYELIEGRIVMPPSPSDEHNTIGLELCIAIKNFAQPRKLGKIWYETDFVFNEDNTRQPDVAFVVAERVPPTSQSSLKIAPDLAVEIWSASDLDTRKEREAARAKIQLYQDSGVRLVWAINPRTQTVLVFYPDTTDNPLILGIADELDGEDVLPGFKLPVKTLFEYEY